LSRVPNPPFLRYRRAYPPPPRLHWLLLLLVGSVGAVMALTLPASPLRDLAIGALEGAWPIYLCVWLRKVDARSTALYWALAALVTGVLFSWLLWIVVVFEVREDLLDHYNRREPIGLRLNLPLTVLLSFVYFQYHLCRIAREKAAAAAIPDVVVEPPAADWETSSEFPD